MNVPLLLRLWDAGGAFLPMGDLGDDAARVNADLEELEAVGYTFERHPYQGVAYQAPATLLCPDVIEWDLGTRRIGRRVAVWSRVGSTNDLAARAAGSSSNDGLVVLAEAQTAGRGRRGRRWSSPPAASILMSVLVFPAHPLDDPAWLTALGAVATAEVVEEWTGRPASIKWPNDVRVGGRKIAGVLVERGAGAVIGIGLNVNAGPGDYPEEDRGALTTIRQLRGEAVDRSLVVRGLIRRLDGHYAIGLDRGDGPLKSSWRGRLEGLGEPVVVETPVGGVSGRLDDADPRAGLLLRTEDGSSRRIASGEILALSPRRESSARI